jgi:hypothetical protein
MTFEGVLSVAMLAAFIWAVSEAAFTIATSLRDPRP